MSTTSETPAATADLAVPTPEHLAPAAPPRGVGAMGPKVDAASGVCRVVLSRWVPSDMVLLLDSSRLAVMPLSGRSFHFKPLATTGDAENGQVIGEYTLECRNENAHAILSGLGTSEE